MGGSALGTTRARSEDLGMVDDDIRVRRVVPADLPGLERFYAELSGDSRESRFHGGCRGITRQQAETFASADHRQRDGFVAIADGRVIGHLVLEPMADGIEELAVAVDDRVQRTGVGTLLMAAAIASARLRHARRLVAWVRADNIAMQHLLTGSHHPLRVSWEGPVARYELAVPDELPRQAAA